MDPIYVTGHRNPDTDSIVAAMAYAALRNACGDREYTAACLGRVSDETQQVLDRFGFQPPMHITNMYTQVRDLIYDTPPLLGTAITVGRAWETLQQERSHTAIPVVNEDGTLYGMLSREDVASYNMTQITTGITLTWEKNEAASKYFIYRYRRVDGAWSEQYKKIVTGDVTSWNDTTVVAGETYRYVIVVNKDGLSSKTSEEVRIMKIGNTTLSLSAQTGRTKVTIKENALATSYAIQRRVADGEWVTLIENTTELVYWDNDVVAGTTYEYRAVATNGTDTCYGKGYSATAK